MGMSKNVLFDLDGTLVDSLPGIQSSILYAINNRGYEIDENSDIKSHIGPPMQEIFSGFLPKLDDELIDEVVAIYREDYQERGLLKTTLFDDILPVLSGLHESGYKLYIATSKRQQFAEDIIRNLNISEYFEAIYGTPSDGALDNKADLLRYI